VNLRRISFEDLLNQTTHLPVYSCVAMVVFDGITQQGDVGHTHTFCFCWKSFYEHVGPIVLLKNKLLSLTLLFS